MRLKEASVLFQLVYPLSGECFGRLTDALSVLGGKEAIETSWRARDIWNFGFLQTFNVTGQPDGQIDYRPLPFMVDHSFPSLKEISRTRPDWD